MNLIIDKAFDIFDKYINNYGEVPYKNALEEMECFLPNQRHLYCSCSNTSIPNFYFYYFNMFTLDNESLRVLFDIWHLLLTIFQTVFLNFLAYIFIKILPKSSKFRQGVWRFLVELTILTFPSIIMYTSANDYVFQMVLVHILILLWLVYKTNCIEKAKQWRQFEIGARCYALTIFRALINYITILCILAIDFENFPRKFRKTRTFGLSLMDLGIGLIVLSMGTVSRRPRRSQDLYRLYRSVGPLLALGFARTIVILAIGYNQDKHEYGVHLNAFFTLGLTKLFGTFISAIASTDNQLLPLGAAVLVIHEVTLQFGISEFVFDDDIKRDTLLTANREGICSLPGFVALYLLSIYIGSTLPCSDALNYNQFMKRINILCQSTFGVFAILVAVCFIGEISRTTCNLGYVVAMIFIALLVITVVLYVYEMVFNTIWPNRDEQLANSYDIESIVETEASKVKPQREIPELFEAISFNGLVFFLIGNLLTGAVNIFLEPENRTEYESWIILFVYMGLSCAIPHLLHRFKIRIA